MQVTHFPIQLHLYFRRFGILLLMLTFFAVGCHKSKPETNCKRGDYNCFLVEYNKRIELEPDNADAYFKRGLLFEAENDADSAILDFSKAISLDPKDSRAYKSRGLNYSDKEQFALAVDDLSKLIQLEPNADNYRILGNA